MGELEAGREDAFSLSLCIAQADAARPQRGQIVHSFDLVVLSERLQREDKVYFLLRPHKEVSEKEYIVLLDMAWITHVQ